MKVDIASPQDLEALRHAQHVERLLDSAIDDATELGRLNDDLVLKLGFATTEARRARRMARNELWICVFLLAVAIVGWLR